MKIQNTKSWILASHGTEGKRDEFAENVAETLRTKGHETQTAFLKGQPSWTDVLKDKRMMAMREIIVIPFMTGGGKLAGDGLKDAMRLSGIWTKRGGQRIGLAEPVGTHPRMVDLVMTQAGTALPEDVQPSRTCLFVVGHGSKSGGGVAEPVKHVVQTINRRKSKNEPSFGDCRAVFLEEEPWLGNWKNQTNLPHAVFVPFFFSKGTHVTEDIPRILGEEGNGVWYAQPVGANTKMLAEIVLSRVEERCDSAD